MSERAAASQPCHHSLNRNQWNILLAANLGWSRRDIEQRYFAGRPDELQPGSQYLSYIAHSGERPTQRGGAAASRFYSMARSRER